MNKLMFLFIAFAIFSVTSCKKDEETPTDDLMCDGTRYVETMFNETTKTTLKYGEAPNNGSNQELFMDVYEPTGDDLAERPLIILAHGGGFQVGNRGLREAQCIEFAKRGYVAATIDYRLLDINIALDSITAVESIVRAVQDMKASIRFFRHDYQNGNQFRINTDLVFVGGYSAGAITAVHTAYWDENDSNIGYINDIVIAEGGLEGNSNDLLTFSSKVQGLLSQSGAIIRKDWIDADEPPVASYHGDTDFIVPSNTGLAAGALIMDGSQEIKERADQLNLTNSLYLVEGGGHFDSYEGALLTQYQEFLNDVYPFFKNQVCN